MAAVREPEDVRLEVDGMTCAACAVRIERRLNALDGVEATVNFATEQATVRAPGVPVGELVAAVTSAGYGARPAATASGAHERGRDEPLRALPRRLRVAGALTAPVVLLAMVPSLQFPGWEWFALVLTTPV